MPKNKTVSICIPSYNNEKFIYRTLKSVLNQTYQNLEIIITDDASIDRTLDIAYSLKDSRIKIFKNNTNSGITTNWNRSINLASGDYIKLVCGDDVIYPSCVEKQVKILDNDKDSRIALVASFTNVIDANDKIIVKRKSLFNSGEITSKQVIKKCIRIGANLIGEPMVGMIRKDSLTQGVQYDGSNPYLIDLDFWFKLLHTGNLYIVNEYLSAFRVSSESLSASLRLDQFQMFKKFIQLQRQKKTIGAFDEAIGITNAFFVALLRKIIFNRHHK